MTESAGLSTRTATHGNRDVQILRSHADTLRGDKPRVQPVRPPSGNARRVQHLQALLAKRRAPSARTPARPASAPPAGPSSLEIALEEAGLAHYRRKLVDNLSCTTVKQLLSLDSQALDSLIDALQGVKDGKD